MHLKLVQSKHTLTFEQRYFSLMPVEDDCPELCECASVGSVRAAIVFIWVDLYCLYLFPFPLVW